MLVVAYTFGSCLCDSVVPLLCDFEWQCICLIDLSLVPRPGNEARSTFTLCAGDCVHGKCWREGRGEERSNKLSDVTWGIRQ